MIVSISTALEADETRGTLAFARPEPNPSHEGVSLRFDLPRAEAASLTVYDVLGRVVTTLASGDQKAGWHQVQWGGDNAGGNSVGTGLFLPALEAEGLTIAH